MKTFVLTISGILLCAGLLFAQQNRPFPRTDLNAVPGTGQSEVNFKLATDDYGDWRTFWYQVSIDGVVVALVEPGIPEKIIIQNGSNKLVIQGGIVNLRRASFAIRYPHREIVIEANSTSTTMELSMRTNASVPSKTYFKMTWPYLSWQGSRQVFLST